MIVTADQLKAFVGFSDPLLLQSLNEAIKRRDITTARRLRYFMTHTSFESSGFTKTSESLFYTTAEVLVKRWPTRFTLKAGSGENLRYAPDYLRNSERLANVVYASRFGNGDEKSGDGFRFRGRGFMQVTFKDNYKAYSLDQYGDERCVADPSKLASPEDAMLSAAWFWASRKLNQLADADEFTKVTKLINGSAVTVPDRLKVLTKANSIF